MGENIRSIIRVYIVRSACQSLRGIQQQLMTRRQRSNPQQSQDTSSAPHHNSQFASNWQYTRSISAGLAILASNISLLLSPSPGSAVGFGTSHRHGHFKLAATWCSTLGQVTHDLASSRSTSSDSSTYTTIMLLTEHWLCLERWYEQMQTPYAFRFKC